MKRWLLTISLIIQVARGFGVEPPRTTGPVSPRNDDARILAGLVPTAPGYESLMASGTWKTHRAFFDENWSRLSTKRLAPVEPWRIAEVNPDTLLKTLYYPFSGPDFLNAYLFFPGYDQYIFYSLEDPGVLPDVRALATEDAEQLLSDVRVSMGDIFKRQFFITKNMLKELRTPVLKGNLPVMAIFMARMGMDIVSIEPVLITPEGKITSSTNTVRGALSRKALLSPVPGVRVVFQRPGGEPQTLVYFSVDVSNKGMKHHPEFLAYLNAQGAGVTLMKSASYLLHGDDFSRIRSAIIRSTDYLLQDDSGLPYRILVDGGWDVRLYGRYTKTVKPFGETIQKDLAAAYAEQKPPRPLPFKFGYHWWDKYSNLMIAQKPAPSPPGEPRAP